MANVPVKWFSNTMTGAPQINVAYGEMVAMLDACLVTGFNLKTAQSITRVGAVATVTFSVAHGYVKDQVINIYDCDQPEYSGDQIVVSATTNSLTFAVTGTPVTPATSSQGSIKCKTSPLGFEILFSSGNRRVYRSTDLTGNRHVLRVDNDAPAGYVAGHTVLGKTHVAESATDVDTLVNFAPYTTGSTSFPQYGWWKWIQAARYVSMYEISASSAISGTRAWVIVGDNRSFYFGSVANPNNATTNYGGARMLYAFGQINSFKPLEAWGTFLWATEGYNLTGSSTSEINYGPRSATMQGVNGSVAGELLLRNWSGVGAATGTAKVSLGTLNPGSTNYLMASGTNTGIGWPNAADYSLILHPVYCGESAGVLRGMFPGIYAIHNNVNGNLPDLSIIDNVTNYSSKKFLIVSTSTGYGTANDGQGRLAFDITGPWR